MESPEGHDGRSPPPALESGRPGRGLGWLEAVLLAGAALFALAFHLRLPSKLPSEADHRAVGRHLEAAAAPGDALLLFPWWTERARLYAPEHLRVVGHPGSDADDLTEHRRIWVLSQPALPRADLEAFEAKFDRGRTPLEPPRRFGPLQLQPFDNGRYRPAGFSLESVLAQAQVYLEDEAGQRVGCARRGQAFACPHPDAPRVGIEWHEILYAPRRCLYLHPPGGETRLVVEWPSLPDATELQLDAGVTWEHAWAHEPGLTPIDVVLEDATGPRLSLTLPPGTEGHRRAILRGAPLAGPVKLWARSDNPRHRDLCVELRGWGATR